MRCGLPLAEKSHCATARVSLGAWAFTICSTRFGLA